MSKDSPELSKAKNDLLQSAKALIEEFYTPTGGDSFDWIVSISAVDDRYVVRVHAGDLPSETKRLIADQNAR